MTFVQPSSNVFPTGPFGAEFWGGYWAPVPSVSSGVTELSGEAQLTGRATSYGSVSLQWSKPSVAFTTYVLVRNTTGWPNTPSEGAVVITGGVTLNNATDSVTSSGTFYYSLFVQLSAATPQWARVGFVMVTVPTNYEGGATLFELIPEWYQSLDSGTTQASINGDNQSYGQLRRFLELIGFQYDIIRTETDTLADLYNASKVRADLLHPLSKMMGFPFEPNSGYRQTRLMMANWISILKSKGTSKSLKLFAEAVTGYSAKVTLGKNMHLSIGDSHFASSFANIYKSTHQSLVTAGTVWQKDFINRLGMPTAAADITVFDTGTLPAAYSVLDYTVTTGLHVSGNPSASSGIGFTCGDPLNAQTTGIPVAASTAYAWSIAVYDLHSTPGVTTGFLTWYDANGVYISSTTNVFTMTQNTWVLNHVYGTSPANAAYLIVGISGSTSHNDMWISASQVELSAVATSWKPARVALIMLYPNRVNYFPNPSFEGSNKYITVAGSSAANISTADKFFGTHSLKLDLVGGSGGETVTWSSIGPGKTIVTPALVANDTWSARSYIKGAQTSIGETVTINFSVFGPGGLIRTASGTPTLLGNMQWSLVQIDAQVSAADIAAGATFVAFTYTWSLGAAVSKSYYVDAMQFERNSIPGQNSYFDGFSDLTTADFAWFFTTNDSASMYYPNRHVRAARLAALLPDFLPINCLSQISYTLPIS